MSNLQKSSSHFSSRRFVIAIALLTISTATVQAENRQSATSVNAPAAALAELVEDAMRIFWLLTGDAGSCNEETPPAPPKPILETEGEIDTEIEIDPPSFP